MTWVPKVNLRGPQGAVGPRGFTGDDGDDGLSAYEVAVDNGFVGDEAEWLASLVGAQGVQGPAGEGLMFTWDGTQLGVKLESAPTYSYVNLLGPAGDEGPQGPKGDPGDIDNLTAQQVIDALTYTPADAAALADIAFSGAASDLVGQVPDSNLHWGIRSSPGAASNLNTDAPVGWARAAASATNIPPGAAAQGSVLTIATSGNNRAQLYFEVDNLGGRLPEVYQRARAGGAWTAWRRISLQAGARYLTTEDSPS